MRIAFLNRGRETHPGGDLIQLDETMNALRALGVECEETGWDVDRIKDGNFDLCHMFHCNFDWSWGNYQAIKQAGKKYVLTPIYYPGLLSGITHRQIQDIVLQASRVLPFSLREVDEISRFTQILNTDPYVKYAPATVIPNGTSYDFHNNGRYDRCGVLCVVARSADKNIGKVKEACEYAEIPFQVVNSVSRFDIPHVYFRSHVFVNASDSERMSLTIGEALCAGCRVLATKENRGNEHYGPGLYTFDPNESVDVLAERIRIAYHQPDWDYSPNIKARQITWGLVAAQLKQVYEEVLAT